MERALDRRHVSALKDAMLGRAGDASNACAAPVKNRKATAKARRFMQSSLSFVIAEADRSLRSARAPGLAGLGMDHFSRRREARERAPGDNGIHGAAQARAPQARKERPAGVDLGSLRQDFKHLRRAVLVAEDNDFYEHEGVDTRAMREAFERNWKRGRITHGGSTITQQLRKNLYLSPSRNPVRKIREYFIARSLEKHLTKKRILELYLNVVELGERTYGAEAGARHHFGKSATDLNPNEWRCSRDVSRIRG
jgi:hypothetical protein